MCGISGIIDQRLPDTVILKKVKAMMHSMEHRGPDESGTFIRNGIGLGHQRLSIIGIEGGRQPIFNEDRSICIVYNGEIYNFKDVKEELISRGHIFTTQTDTEVIVHAYEEFGDDCIDNLRGMFAFAIWDERKKRLFIARDRLGIKPLYYIHRNKIFAFASEIKAFFVSQVLEPLVNIQALDSYITLNYVLGPETAFKEVQKLPPGHYLVFENDDLKINKYWDFHDIKKTALPLQDCIERLNQHLKESVKIHLMSEVPLGVFLSGGLDSSLTVGVMSELSTRPIKTFTVGYEGDTDVSELKYARVVAEHFKTEHYELMLNPAGFNDAIPQVLWHLDEPIGEYATVPLMLLSKLAKEHVTVMLSGEGADEMFGGYPVYFYMSLIERYQEIPEVLRRTILYILLKMMVGGRKYGKYMEWFSLPLERRYLGNGSYFTEGMKKRLYTDDMWNTVNRERLYSKVDSYYKKVSEQDPVSRMLYMDTKTWLPEDLLLKADKTTMAASLELRVPFLDHKLLEFATSLPSRMKVNFAETKYILKKAAHALLPRDIIYRRKQGFPVPMKKWLKTDLNHLAKEILLDTRSRQRGYFNTSFIEQMLNRHSTSEDDLNVNIWNLLVLEFWHRLFIDGDSGFLYSRQMANRSITKKPACSR